MWRRDIQKEESAHFGVGAMVVFIAMVLVAMIVSSSIILIVEKMAQQTQRTSADAQRDSVNTVIIVGGWVGDDYDDYLFMMEFGSSGDQVTRVDVIYVLTCTHPDGTFYYRSAALGNSMGGSALFVWEVGDDKPATIAGNVNQFSPGARYFFTLDGGTNAAPGGDECGPIDLDQNGINAKLALHLPYGMSTFQDLALSNGRVIGSQVI